MSLELDLTLMTIQDICKELKRRKLAYSLIIMDPDNTVHSKHSPPYYTDFDSGPYSGCWLIGALNRQIHDIHGCWDKAEDALNEER